MIMNLSGSECRTYNIPKKHLLYRFKPEHLGNRHLPYDERRLNFKVFNLNLTNQIYDFSVLKILNPPRDVIPDSVHQILMKDSLAENMVLLGNSWWTKELDNMRWGSTDMEILVMNATQDSVTISMDLEPGPSLVNIPLSFEVVDSRDELIDKKVIMKREKIKLRLPLKIGERYQTFRINVLNDIKPLDDGKILFLGIDLKSFLNRLTNQEHRDLNLRLFQMKVIPD